MDIQPRGERKRGIPRTRWVDDVNRDMKMAERKVADDRRRSMANNY